MMSFRGDKIARQSYSGSTTWLLSDLGEHKGRQALFTRQSPQVLDTLREHALIQSTESSNRIEGVTVASDRLAPLVLGNTKPKDRAEEEIVGYRNALNLIHTHSASLSIEPQTLLKLHGIIQAGAGDAGEWKKNDNQIIEVLPNQPPRVRFTPTSAADTPAAMDELCLLYRRAIDQSLAPPLIVSAAMVLDFLCIHPFRDGNGRVSRLLTLLVLYQHGYEVGRYVGLERLVEESKDDYYAALHESSRDWHAGKHELLPFVNFFLSIIRRGYVEFEKRVDQTQTARGGKRAIVEDAIRAFPGEFTFADLHRACPGVSVDMIRHVMQELKAKGDLMSQGRGRAARWMNKGNK